MEGEEPRRRRGARRGRGWDAAPARQPSAGTGSQRRGTRRQAGDTEADPASTGGGAGSGGTRQQRDPAELAREICLRQLAVRPRTRAELATALGRGGIPDEVAAQVLDRYDEVGMIDDAAFARAWVSSRHHGRGLARRALASELRQRGVDSDTVGEALESLDPDTEAATARALAERKLRGMRRADPATAFRKLVAMLARKGYPPGVAVGAVREALAGYEADSAIFAQEIDEDALTDALGAPEETD